jgi:DUF971 family protein
VEAQGKRKRSPNGTRKEQVTLSKLDQGLRDLANIGQNYMRMYIATINAFPDSTTKGVFSWRRLEESIENHVDLRELKEEVAKDADSKAKLVEYVSFFKCAQSQIF